jgi:uncharacterized protein HemX
LEVIMALSEGDLIDRLQRTSRRWRTLALAAVAALILVGLGAAGFCFVQHQRAEQAHQEAKAQRDRAEQMRQDALWQAQQAQAAAQRALYAAHLQAAHQEWLAGAKPSVEDK